MAHALFGFVEDAANVRVDRGWLVREWFVGRAFAGWVAALAALAALLVLLVAPRAAESPAIEACRAWRGYPVVILAGVSALSADRHTPAAYYIFGARQSIDE